MGKIALALKINLNEIDMARVFQGKKGQYLDATIFVSMDELDQYGNSGMITQDVSKEEKAAGTKGAILGNGKVFWVENGQAPQQAGQQSQGGGFNQQAPQYQSQEHKQPNRYTQQQAPQGGFNQQHGTAAAQAPRDSQGFTAAQGGFSQNGGQSGK
tara:strand:- start:9898 stop:10365 length:468 start_codon:yes stop_codon:yes gene_type:complete